LYQNTHLTQIAFIYHPERALRLTGLCLKLNPANYSIWHFRRQCLDAIITNENIAQIIQQDLQLAADLGGANPKNYQIWYHRRALLESAAQRNNDMSAYVPAELDYVATVLEEDSKNYHAWSHRQWVIRTANDETCWDEELEFGK
jgi:protein farnesyltransferase/geranylgeranyltransferase type-1 subunit alpha